MDYYTPKKYLEFKVLEWDAKCAAPKRKEPTEKAYVMITEKEAFTLNSMSLNRNLWYELEPEVEAETKPTKPAK